MLILVLLFPLLSTICCGLFGAYLGKVGICVVSLSCLSLACLCSFWLFIGSAIMGDVLTLELWPWFVNGNFFLSWGLLYDGVTSVMFLVVTFISLLVHFYSIGYMDTDPHFGRFFSYLSLFTFFMLVLVSADNFVQLFVGWEGVGLCSFLLISFWYTRVQANKAAMKALIVNRIGDFSLIAGVGLIFLLCKTAKFSVIFAVVPYLFFSGHIILFEISFPLISVICLFLFIGAVGKSAQIGLHTWLPDAMEGPTPVSALIHAATMVTAGVFLVIRCSPLFEYAPSILLLLLFVGALTSFFAATVGLVQHDIKKIIAYSTCSQLGYMIVACGFSNYAFSLYHLTTHACFKALLSLCAGSVIHALTDEQDIRRMGGLRQLLPVTYICMLVGSFALIGFPFLSGFYSKDLIIESARGSMLFGSNFIYWVCVIVALLTTVYSTRLLFFTFLDQPNGSRQLFLQVHESSFFLLLPLIVLSILSIFVGYMLQEIFAGIGTHFFGQAIFVLPSNCQVIEMEFLPWTVKIVPIFLSLGGFSITLLTYFFHFAGLYFLKIKFYNVFHFLTKKWYFDIVYNKIFIYPLLMGSYTKIYRILDKGLLEWVGPRGLSCFFSQLSRQVMHLHTAVIYHYICFLFLGLGFLLIFCLFMFW